MQNKPNSLANEVSPYLLQHSMNPVRWYPWNDTTLSIAKEENKMLLISIGYSSCHWCHVMENESFMDPEVAEIMNRYYICVKVDREERPDIDQLYMNAVQIITRRGGWPLNCFALPDGRPVYGGTYFPKEQWKDILESLHTTWDNTPSRVIEVADELEDGIANSEIIHRKAPVEPSKHKELLHATVQSIELLLDQKNGGIMGAPKFPMAGLLKFLLIYSTHGQNSNIDSFIDTTLDKIYRGGIHDHVGGGFFRYSVDEKWHVPHFEKMLYDNALLIELYALAYRTNKNPNYRTAATRAITFMTEWLRSPDDAFYSALDADSNGIEGSFYTWGKDEIEKILGYDTELFCAAYGITDTGNWNKTNVLTCCANNKQLEFIFEIPKQEIEYRITRCLTKLKEARNKQSAPQVDDKIITSWNAMAITALTEAYISFNKEEYLQLAQSAVNYIEQTHFVNGELHRISCKGQVYTQPLLDDYAYLTQAYIALHRATLDTTWINKAENLIHAAQQHYWDSQSGMFFYTPASSKLFIRKMELIDGAIPSANAVMAINLNTLSNITNNNNYSTMANQMLANIAENFNKSGIYLYKWLELALQQQLSPIHIAIPKNMEKIIEEIQSNTIYPNTMIEITENPTSAITLCFSNRCTNPPDSETIIAQINRTKVE